MKKSLLALAALTAFAGVASAQSSVTLFGVVDVNARNVKNGSPSLKSLSTDGNSSSRIGFRGVEDLGGGLRAGFWIEGAYGGDTGTGAGSVGNGSAAQEWRRRATLSLIGGFGEVRLGRDYTPTFWNHTIFDPFGTNGVGSQTNLMVQQGQASMLASGSTTLVRANNSIGYFLPAMGGVYGQVMVAAGEGAFGNKYTGFRLGYAAGPVNFAGSWGKTQATPTRDLTAMNFGGSFNLGFMTLMGQWHKYKVDAPSVDQTNILIGANVPVGKGTFKVSYGKASSTGVTRDATQIALGYVHDLSKRTALYTHFAKISNEGNAAAGARFVASGSGPAGLMATGSGSTGYEFGVRHSF